MAWQKNNSFMLFKLLLFGKMIPNIRLQKNNLERIFHYAYKDKIIICIGGLPFHQSSGLKTAITTSLYSVKISLLSIGGLNYI